MAKFNSSEIRSKLSAAIIDQHAEQEVKLGKISPDPDEGVACVKAHVLDGKDFRQKEIGVKPGAIQNPGAPERVIEILQNYL